MTVFAAIISPLFIIFPIFFGVIILRSQFNGAAVFLMIMCMSCSVIWGYFLLSKRNVLYSWGVFQPNAVHVKVLFEKTATIPYEKCKSCGIAFYRHALLNDSKSLFGSDCFFIFLSMDSFDEKYRNRINMWLPSQNRIKVRFSKKLYNHLINWLPSKQANMLKKDYMKYFANVA